MNPDLEKNLIRLRQISNDLKRNKICDEDRIWLAEALYKIYEGADANFILDIEGGRGQRRENTHRNHMIDLAMHYAAGLHDKELGGDKTVKESIEIASKKFGLEINTLKRYWNDNNKKTMQSIIRDDSTYD
jgi:hypothetical protein